MPWCSALVRWAARDDDTAVVRESTGEARVKGTVVRLCATVGPVMAAVAASSIITQGLLLYAYQVGVLLITFCSINRTLQHSVVCITLLWLMLE
eukprot:gene27112-50756_t